MTESSVNAFTLIKLSNEGLSLDLVKEERRSPLYGRPPLDYDPDTPFQNLEDFLEPILMRLQAERRLQIEGGEGLKFFLPFVGEVRWVVPLTILLRGR
jgi:hypothetical protein